jgi:hypothetical protein
MRDYQVTWDSGHIFTFHNCEDILVAIARAIKLRPGVEIVKIEVKSY